MCAPKVVFFCASQLGRRSHELSYQAVKICFKGRCMPDIVPDTGFTTAVFSSAFRAVGVHGSQSAQNGVLPLKTGAHQDTVVVRCMSYTTSLIEVGLAACQANPLVMRLQHCKARYPHALFLHLEVTPCMYFEGVLPFGGCCQTTWPSLALKSSRLLQCDTG